MGHWQATCAHRRRWARHAGVALGAVLALLAPGCAASWGQQSSKPRPVAEGDCPFGSFRRVEGVGVLTLWGNPYQRGFAHGWLLAPAVVDVVDVVVGSRLLLARKRHYEEVVLPLMERFAFEPDDEAELQGLFDGVRFRLGPAPMLPRVGRPLELRDLRACNTAGDWYRQACSSFAAWGSRTQDRHVWVGRNFDFLPARAFFTHQMLIVHKPLGDKKAWATVAAPGFIGCITGINEDGVFASVHDVFLRLRPLEAGYAPRLLTLRRLMEACRAADLAAQALPILEARKQMFDNAILLAAPVRDGTPPALVFEYNNDYTRDKGVTIRDPHDNEKGLGHEMLICTNHFRKRTNPAPGPAELRYTVLGISDIRYILLRRALLAKAKSGEGLGFEAARRAMAAARLPITVHTAIADLDTLDFWLARGEFLTPPSKRDFAKLPLRRWLLPSE